MFIFSNLSKSLTINERYALIKSYFNETKLNQNSLQYWRDDMSILSNGEFQNMLKKNNYKLAIFSNAVSYNPTYPLLNIFEKYAKQSSWYILLEKIINSFQTTHFPKRDFSYILRPFIYYTNNQIRQLCKRYNSIINKQLGNNLIESYRTLILKFSRKMLVYELNLKKKYNLLKGQDPNERFYNFLSHYDDVEEILKLLDKYIVMTRLIVIATENFLHNTNRMLEHIYNNIDFVKDITNTKSYIAIKKIKFNQGDTHNHGLAVSIITLDNNAKFVYKPKFSQSDSFLNRLIQFINNIDSNNGIKPIRTLTKTNYLIQEYISHDQCSTLSELKEFYANFGKLLAILYSLNATDIHMENIIANKTTPVIIDSESIFQQPIHFYNHKDLFNQINEELFLNVTSTGMLPDVMSGNKNKIDVSALYGKQNVYPKEAWKLKEDKTDDIHYEETNIILEKAQNQPTENTYPEHFVENIIDGFQKVYLTIMSNRDKILKSIIQDEIDSLRIRMIFRNSQFYFELLNHTLHPDFLRNMLDREKALENIWSFDTPYLDVIASEYRQLLFHDIPIFYNQLKINTLINSDNDIISNKLQYNSLKLFQKKLNRLNKKDLKKQMELIQLSVSRKPFRTYSLNTPISSLKAQKVNYDYLIEAKKIANYIMNQSIQNKKGITWINYTNDPQNILKPINSSFYNGKSGLILFFLKLYELCGDQKYLDFSQKLTQSISGNDHNNKHLRGISGDYGLLYAKSYLDNDYYFIDKKLKELGMNEYYSLHLESNEDLDYLNGLSGYLSMLIRMYRQQKDKVILQECIKISDFIQKNIDIKALQKEGFGHGLMGYLTVFHNMWLLTAYERYNRFIKILKHNIDSRKNTTNTSNTSWCNGITGTMIGKILINFWEQSTLQYPIYIMNNDSLCHGNSGTVELFWLLYEGTGESIYYENAINIANNMIKNKLKSGDYQLNDIEGYRTVGLFNGLAGVGYQFLRLTDKKNVQSILIG